MGDVVYPNPTPHLPFVVFPTLESQGDCGYAKIATTRCPGEIACSGHGEIPTAMYPCTELCSTSYSTLSPYLMFNLNQASALGHRHILVLATLDGLEVIVPSSRFVCIKLH